MSSTKWIRDEFNNAGLPTEPGTAGTWIAAAERLPQTAPYALVKLSAR